MVAPLSWRISCSSSVRRFKIFVSSRLKFKAGTWGGVGVNGRSMLMEFKSNLYTTTTCCSTRVGKNTLNLPTLYTKRFSVIINPRHIDSLDT